MDTLVIAEAGSCHDGELEKAKRLIHVAKEAAADICKFQYWSDADKLADRRHVEQHYREIYRKYQMPAAWLPILKAECDAVGLEFMATTYLSEDIATVAPYVQRFKISSFEAQDRPFVLAHAKYLRETIVSHGMSDAYEDGPFLDADYERDLHCVSAYPCPIEQMNLAVIRGDDSGWDGVSDHSGRETTGGIAVAAGARIVEVHFRDYITSPKNPDVACALNPAKLARYIAFVREVEVMMGDGIKRVMPCEEAMRKYQVRAS